jgi:EAL domain-containing protein (putative c-di-GMP-specific phosphodiesterase class I)
VLEASISQSAVWARAGIKMAVSVNVSARDLHDLEFPEELARLLDFHGVPADQIVLEITESAVMEEPGRAASVLARLRESGLGIAIDDFGIGHSSLAYLKQFPVEELKIDKSFVMGATPDAQSLTIVRSAIGLGHGLGLRVTAEGVDTPDVLDLLGELGCDYVQGYLVGRPVEASEITAAVREPPPLVLRTH